MIHIQRSALSASDCFGGDFADVVVAFTLNHLHLLNLLGDFLLVVLVAFAFNLLTRFLYYALLRNFLLRLLYNTFLGLFLTCVLGYLFLLEFLNSRNDYVFVNRFFRWVFNRLGDFLNSFACFNNDNVLIHRVSSFNGWRNKFLVFLNAVTVTPNFRWPIGWIESLVVDGCQLLNEVQADVVIGDVTLDAAIRQRSD